MDTNPVLHWTDHAGERQAWPLTKLQEEFKAFLAWRAQQPALGAFFRQELAKMDSEDPGLAPLNGMMLDLRHAALKYLAKGSRVAEMVIAMLDASPERLPAASGEPVAEVRMAHESFGFVLLGDLPPDGTRLYAAPQPAPRLKWMEAPRRTEWGAGMMETLIALSADETLQLYAHRDAVPMVDALLSAQPAPARVPLTDEQAESLIENSDGRWHDGEFRIDGPDLMKLLRDAAQPAPARVPLTDAQIDQIKAQPGCWEHVGQRIEFRYRPFARAIEAHHGITAQGEPK